MINEDTLQKLENEYDSIKRRSLADVKAAVMTEFKVSEFVGTADQHAAMLKVVNDEVSRMYTAADRHRRAQQQLVNSKFMEMLFVNARTVNRKALELIYAKAYEDGHSAGFYEISSKFDELDDLVADCLAAVDEPLALKCEVVDDE